MRSLILRLPTWLLELIPVVAGVVTAFGYFIVVLPATLPFTGEYFLAAFVIYGITRIPANWYFKRHLLPPLRNYLSARRAGRALSQSELRDTYLALSSHLSRSTRANLLLWAFSAVLLLAADQIWLVGTVLSMVTLLFTTSIIVMIALVLSYYINKARLEPVMEEVQLLLERTPDVASRRISLSRKLVVVVFGMNSLVFLAFGVLLYAQMARAIQAGVLRSSETQIRGLLDRLEGTGKEGWLDVLRAGTPDGCESAVVDATGTPLAEHPEGAFGGASGMRKWLRRSGMIGKDQIQVSTPKGQARLLPGPGGTGLVVLASPGLTAPKRMFGIFTVGFGYLLVALVVMGGYIGLFGSDLGRIGAKIAAFSHSLAAGDLRKPVAGWSDDELGAVSDNLRTQFSGLRDLATEVSRSVALVEEEIGRLARTADSLGRDSEEQARSIARTREAVRGAQDSSVRVSRSMEEVAASTQEVSSTVLQMQANTEEIAGNADVLTQSVEQTAASSNEIACASEEIGRSTTELERSGQETVSFFTELDATLEETRVNAGTLLSTAMELKRDASEGHEAVREVEETIQATHQAIEGSRQDLQVLHEVLGRIGSVTEVIQEISEQTHLLSLNASIIAAGAGEYGRPFAVVAQQIRELSRRTAANVKEIRSHVQSVQEGRERMVGSVSRSADAAEKSTRLSRRAGEALTTILRSAERQEEVSRTIASAAEEVALGGNHAGLALQRIFSQIQEISRAVEQEIRATRLLHEESERVREVASQVRTATGEQARGAVLMSQAASRISEQAQETSGAARSQADAASSILGAVERINSAAGGLREACGELSRSATRLQEGARRLSRSVQAIRL
ncbi:MAG: methyl-accepting chemotaxis protein [Acidobacteriota bacterium]